MRPPLLLHATVLAAVLSLAGCARTGAPADAAAAGSSDPASAAGLRIADDLPLLHANPANAARSPETVRAVYEFAARHPEVLSYVPCFCGCERGGHRGNEDCFVAHRNASGQVTAWEPHGLVCETCVDVGQMAMEMHNRGATPAAIREAVERRFAGQPNHTPTPLPPGMSTAH